MPEFQKHARDAAAAVDNARDPPINSATALMRRIVLVRSAL